MNTLTELERALTEAQEISKTLVADVHQGQSQFAAPLRSAIDHAAELLGHHKQWTAENTPKI